MKWYSHILNPHLLSVSTDCHTFLTQSTFLSFTLKNVWWHQWMWAAHSLFFLLFFCSEGKCSTWQGKFRPPCLGPVAAIWMDTFTFLEVVMTTDRPIRWGWYVRKLMLHIEYMILVDVTDLFLCAFKIRNSEFNF